jgi:hypothetical protein
MCLRKCFVNGFCEKVIPSKGVMISGDGKRLYYPAKFPSDATLSHFWGDVEWKRNRDGSFLVREHHNIERMALHALDSIPKHRCMSTGQILFEARRRLKNPHLYSSLVGERLRSLLRRGWIREYNPGVWVITAKGRKAAKQYSRHFPV